MEVEADLPPDYCDPIRELLLAGTNPDSLTHSLIESQLSGKRDVS